MATEVSVRDAVLALVTEERVLDLAKKVIGIPSPTGEETELAHFLAEYMGQHGIETELLEVEAGRFQPVGRIRGSAGGHTLMFNGHMDVDHVFAGVKDAYVPIVDGRRLYGHGIFNMKAGVVAMVEAAVAVKRSGAELLGDLIITPVVGELQGGVGTVFNLEQGITADYGLVPEPYGEYFCLTHAGVQHMAITLRCVSTHVSVKEHGVNLPMQLARLIEALNAIEFEAPADPRLPGLPRLIIGSIICAHGDTYELRGACFQPDICTVIVDARFHHGMNPSEDVLKVLKRLADEDPTFQYEFLVSPDRLSDPGVPFYNNRLTLPPTDVSPDELIVQVHARNYEQLTGSPPEVGSIPPGDDRHTMAYCGDDDAHLTNAGIPSFVCGPGGGWGTAGQYVDIDSMVRVARNFALTAYDICNTPKQ